MNKEQDEVFEQVSAVLQKIVKVSANQLTEDMRLMEDLGADSVELWDVVLSVEKIFSIRFRKEELNKISTIADLIELIRCKQSSTKKRQ